MHMHVAPLLAEFTVTYLKLFFLIFLNSIKWHTSCYCTHRHHAALQPMQHYAAATMQQYNLLQKVKHT